MLKKILYITLVFLLLLLSSSCNMLQGEVKDDSLSQVMKEKKLVIGMKYAMSIMGTLDPDTGEAYGFDVDLANELGSRMGINIEFIYVPWADGSNNFEKSRAMCIWNGFDSTPERQKKYALSIPYIRNDKKFIVLKNNAIKTVEELEGKTLGVSKGSSNEYSLNNPINKQFKRKLGNIETFNTYEEGFELLEMGQIDSILLDEVVAKGYNKENTGKYKFLNDENNKDYNITGYECVIAFRRNDLALRTEINQVLLEMSQDGTIEEISRKWFGEDISVIK